MASTADGLRRGWLVRFAPGELGLVGQTSTSWGVAGGLLAALIVCGHMFAGGLSSSVGFLTGSLFFLVGSAIGFVHGAILGYLGRPEGVTRLRALKRIALGAVYEVPVLLLGWTIAMMLVLSATAYQSGRYVTLAVTLAGWVGAVLLFVWAGVETVKVLGHLQRRWPDAHALLITITLAGLALLPVFLLTRPEIWVLGVEPSPTAAVLMALGAALWIVGPLAALALLAVRAWSRAGTESPSPSSHV